MSSSSSKSSSSVPDYFHASAIQQHIQENQPPDGSTLPPRCRARSVTQKQPDELEPARVRESSNTGSAKHVRSCPVEKKIEACIVPVELENTATQVEGGDLKSPNLEKLPGHHIPKTGLVGHGLSTSMPIDTRTDVAIPELLEPQAPASSGFREDPESASTSTSIPPADDWEALKAYACGPSALPAETLEAAEPLHALPALEPVDSSAPPLCLPSSGLFHVNKLESSSTPLAVYPAPAYVCQSGALDALTHHDNSAVLVQSPPYIDHQLKYFPAHPSPPPGLAHPAVRGGLAEGEEQEEPPVSLCQGFAGDEFVEHEAGDFLLQGADKGVSKEVCAGRGSPRLKSKAKREQQILKQRCRMHLLQATGTVSSQSQDDEELEEEGREEEKPATNARQIWAEVRQVLGNTEWAYGCSHPVPARCEPAVSSIRVQREGQEDMRPR